MATISNRFESLLINAQNPLEQSKKKAKKRNEAKPAKPQPAKSTSPKLNEAEPKPVEAPSVTKPRSVQGVKKEFVHSSNVIITDITSKPQKSVTFAPKESQVIIEDISSTKEKQETKAVEESPIDLDLKSRANSNRYQKVFVNRGRVLERHGPSRSFRQSEKRHGHGAYNWGDQLENSATTVEGDESTLDQSKQSEAPEESVPVNFTILQYKKLVQENKVDPLAWTKSNEKSEAIVSEKNEAREYEYTRSYQSPRARGERRYSGRGVGRSRGNDSNPRVEHRGDGPAKRQSNAVVNVNVDDPKDFPDL